MTSNSPVKSSSRLYQQH